MLSWAITLPLVVWVIGFLISSSYEFEDFVETTKTEQMIFRITFFILISSVLFIIWPIWAGQQLKMAHEKLTYLYNQKRRKFDSKKKPDWQE